MTVKKVEVKNGKWDYTMGQFGYTRKLCKFKFKLYDNFSIMYDRLYVKWYYEVDHNNEWWPKKVSKQHSDEKALKVKTCSTTYMYINTIEF